MRARVTGVLVGLALGLVTPPAAGAQGVPGEDRVRGLVYEGLTPGGAGSPCGPRFELRLEGRVVGCTHGPDPAPEGVDVRRRREAPVSGFAMEGPPSAICHGDGQSGFRVQLLYARTSDTPDRYAQFVGSFRQWAAQTDDIINLSAVATGGTRHVQFVHDNSCVPTVERVVLPPQGDDNLTQTRNALSALGYSRVDRKYLVWMDATVYCGIADGLVEDHPSEDNVHNGSGRYPGMVARIDSGCWGRAAPSGLVEAHELVHTLGAVQPSAPNATQWGHCTDEYDLMCYPDAAGVTTRVVCDNIYEHENRLDCNHDDYFHTNPPPGSYLDTHWNVARNRFLTARGTTVVSPMSGSPGDPVSVRGTGARPFHTYRVTLGTSSVGCPGSSLVLGGSVLADSSGNIPVVTRTIPTNTTSGQRYLCLASTSDPANDFTAPTPFTVF